LRAVACVYGRWRRSPRRCGRSRGPASAPRPRPRCRGPARRAATAG
jgi:hypothetical protein